MPLIPSAILSGLTLALLTTWALSYPSLLRGLRHLLAETPGEAGTSAWRGRTVLLVVIAWFAVTIFTQTTYLLLRGNVGRKSDRAAIGLKSPAEKTGPAPPRGKVDVRRKITSVMPVQREIGRETEKRFLSVFEVIALSSITNGTLLVVIPMLLLTETPSLLKHLGLARINLSRDLKIGGVAFLVVTPLVLAINLLALQVWRQNKHPVEEMLRKGLGPGTVALAYLSAMVLAPVAEELLFRGVIQAWLRGVWQNRNRHQPLSVTLSAGAADTLESPVSPAPPTSGLLLHGLPRPVKLLVGRVFRPLSSGAFSVLLTSTLFALLHVDQMPAPFAIFALSLMLGWLYDRTGGILASTVLHALFNGFNTTLMLLSLLFTPPASPTAPAPKVSPVGSEKSVERQDFSLSSLASDDRF